MPHSPSLPSLLSSLSLSSLSQLVGRRLSSALAHLDALHTRVCDSQSKILVTGDLNAGKSTFVNSVLGREILPSDQQPCTTLFSEVLDASGNGNREEVHAVPDLNRYDPADASTYDVFKIEDLHELQRSNEPEEEYLSDEEAPVPARIARGKYSYLKIFVGGEAKAWGSGGGMGASRGLLSSGDRENGSRQLRLGGDSGGDSSGDNNGDSSGDSSGDSTGDNTRNSTRNNTRDPAMTINLIDAPGLNKDTLSTTELFTRQTEIDVIVFLVSAENHLTLSAKEFLSTASNEKAFVFVVVNKWAAIRDKARCRRMVGKQIKELSPATWRDRDELVHWVELEGEPSRDTIAWGEAWGGAKAIDGPVPGGRALLGAGENSADVNSAAGTSLRSLSPTRGDSLDSVSSESETALVRTNAGRGRLSAESLSAENLPPESLPSVLSSLRSFVLLKRSRSKLAPAQHYLLNLLGDLDTLARVNVQAAADELRTAENEVLRITPLHRGLQELRESIEHNMSWLEDSLVGTIQGRVSGVLGAALEAVGRGELPGRGSERSGVRGGAAAEATTSPHIPALPRNVSHGNEVELRARDPSEYEHHVPSLGSGAVVVSPNAPHPLTPPAHLASLRINSAEILHSPEDAFTPPPALPPYPGVLSLFSWAQQVQQCFVQALEGQLRLAEDMARAETTRGVEWIMGFREPGDGEAGEATERSERAENHGEHGHGGANWEIGGNREIGETREIGRNREIGGNREGSDNRNGPLPLHEARRATDVNRAGVPDTALNSVNSALSTINPANSVVELAEGVSGGSGTPARIFKPNVMFSRRRRTHGRAASAGQLSGLRTSPHSPHASRGARGMHVDPSDALSLADLVDFDRLLFWRTDDGTGTAAVSLTVGSVGLLGSRVLGLRQGAEALEALLRAAPRRWLLPALLLAAASLASYVVYDLPRAVPKNLGRKIALLLEEDGFARANESRIAGESRKVLRLAGWDLRERFRDAYERTEREKRRLEGDVRRTTEAVGWLEEFMGEIRDERKRVVSVSL